MTDRKKGERTIEDLVAAGEINPAKFGLPDDGLTVTPPPEGDTTEQDYKDYKFPSDE